MYFNFSEHSCLIKDTERLLSLTDTLNLDDCDKSSLGLYNSGHCSPLVQDFERLSRHVSEQKKITSSYGLDHPMFDNSLFVRMRVLVHQLPLHTEAEMAYCMMKTELFLEVNEFFDEIFTKVDNQLKTARDSDLVQRLLTLLIRLRKMYDIHM